MTENSSNKDTKTFVTEQIKEKPISRKRLLKKVGTAALCGLVFALCALLVTALGQKLMNRKKPQSASLNVQQEETETDTRSAQDPEDEAAENTDAEDTAIVEEIPLTLDDYQNLQNQLYDVGRSANHSIVAITGITKETDWFNNIYETETAGSGAIISETDEELLILTEKDAIPSDSRIQVTFSDGASAEASVKAEDEGTGIVVLTLEKSSLSNTTLSELTVASLGSSHRIKAGQLVLALGNPLGTAFSIQTGTVISTESEVSSQDDNFTILSTDISGNEESSGVLINTKGEIIGLITRESSADQSSAPQSFTGLKAMALSDVEGIIRRLINGKSIPYAGLYLTTVTDEITEEYGIPAGVYIREAVVDSPAMLAGLQSGDVITYLDAVPISSVGGFHAQLLTYNEGDLCTVTVQRPGKDGYNEVRCKVTLGRQTSSEGQSQSSNRKQPETGNGEEAQEQNLSVTGTEADTQTENQTENQSENQTGAGTEEDAQDQREAGTEADSQN